MARIRHLPSAVRLGLAAFARPRTRRPRLATVLLGGAALFMASALSIWSGENGTEAATAPVRMIPGVVAAPVPATAPSVAATVPSVAVTVPSVAATISAADTTGSLGETAQRPEAVGGSDATVLASAGTLSRAAESPRDEPALDSWRSTTAEPEPVTRRPLPVIMAALSEPAVAGPETRIAPPAPPRPLVRSGEPAFSRVLLGRWVPSRDVCTDPGASEFLPLEISASRAVAGDGECSFSSKRKVGSDWTVVAQCSDGVSNWTSNVTLGVSQRRLTWTSERGTQSYERCGPVVAARKQHVASRHRAVRSARAPLTRSASLRPRG